MKDTKKDTSKLNPEIKKKLDELCLVIEEEITEKGFDEVSDAMARSFGDFLNIDEGFDALNSAFERSRPGSQNSNDLGLLEELARQKEILDLCIHAVINTDHQIDPIGLHWAAERYFVLTEEIENRYKQAS